MMNPLIMVKADYRAMRGSAWAIVLLVAFAVAIGVALAAQEKALRTSTTRAAARIRASKPLRRSPSEMSCRAIRLSGPRWIF